jgi:hypothetical protein
MRIAKEDVLVKINAPGAVARQQTEFGDASGFGKISGEAEKVAAGDLFYWPPGHTVLALEDTEMVLFSPQREHTHVLDHILHKMKA